MTTLRRLMIPTVLLLIVSMLAVPAFADDKTITIIDDDGVTYVCTYVDGEYVKVVNKDTGEEVLDFDIEELEHTIEEAMEEVEEALEELEDLDIDLHLGGDDSFLRMELGDERVFIDVEAIVEGVMEAVEHIGEIDFGEIHIDHDHDREHAEHVKVRVKHDRESLEDELDKLRDEIAELKKELKKANRGSRH